MNGGSGAGGLILLVPLALLLVWIFLTQRRRQRGVQAVQAALAVGDEVCTTSGLFGIITALDERVATLEVAPTVLVRYDRRAIGLRVEGTGPTKTHPQASPETPRSPTPPSGQGE